MSSTQQTIAEAGLGATSGIRLRPQPALYGLPWSFAFLIADTLVALLAAVAAQHLVQRSLERLLDNDAATESVIFAVAIWLLLFERIGMYRRSFSSNALDEIYSSFAACALAMAPALGIFIILPGLHPFRTVLIVALIITAVGVSTTRFLAYVIRTRAFPPLARRIAIIGAPERVREVPRDLSLGAADEIVRIPIEDFDEEIASAGGDVNALSWLQLVLERGCDEIIVTEALPAELMPALLRVTESRGIKLAFAPMRIRPHACDFSVRRDGGLALLYPRSLSICTPGVLMMRRLFDLAIALPALVLLSPVFGVIALLVFSDSGKPIFYRQIRIGRHGREFRIIKFRTMRTDAESRSGPVWARSGEDRTTRIGRILRRTSLDELPQLFNVVRGEMSIVGPRPERPFYVEQFRKMLPRYDERHLAKPGITGWSHIHMRRNVDTSAIGERLSYDLFYLENWSIFMDVLIICKTAAEFLFTRPHSHGRKPAQTVVKAPAGGLLRKTLHTFATLLFGQGASVAAGIATAHAFGPAGKGVISFASILIAFAVTTADGLRSAVAYQIGTERLEGRAVWHAALRIMACLAPLTIAIFLALAYLHASQPAYLYVAVAFPFAMYVQAVGIVYLLRDHVEAINVKNAATIGGGGSLLTLVLILVFHAPLAVVLWAWVATYVAAAVWSTFGVEGMLDATSKAADAAANATHLVRQQLTFGAKSTLSSNVTFLALRIDVFVVSALLSPSALGVYTLALATGEVMWGVSRSLLWSSSGRVATLPFEESAALTARVVRSVVALQIGAGIVLFAVGPWLITHVYGARFAGSGGVLRLLLPGMILYSADGMLSYFISIRAGRPGLLLGLECVTLVVCGSITYATVGHFGIYGAALANTVAYLASYAIKVVFFVRLSGVGASAVLFPRGSDVPNSIRKRFGLGPAALTSEI